MGVCKEQAQWRFATDRSQYKLQDVPKYVRTHQIIQNDQHCQARGPGITLFSVAIAT